jgi:CheY-like chemotaxis protein
LLIVDDEPLFARSLGLLLQPEHDVTLAGTAHEALEKLRDGARYDAILCDLMMAEMTGGQFHEALSRLIPEQAERIIFMTGGAFTADTQALLARVSNPRLLKPFTEEALHALLAPLLQEPHAR